MSYKTLKFKLYFNKRRNAFLHGCIETFSNPYNHLLATRGSSQSHNIFRCFEAPIF